MGAVLINGRILGVTEATNWMGEVIAKGPFSYFWLTNGDICALCGPKTMITFIITPLVGAFFTLLLSALDIAIRGEAARKPLFASYLGLEEKTVEVEDGNVDDLELKTEQAAESA